MENYRPSQPSVASKILGNPILHVAAIFILVFGAVVFIQQQRKVEIRERAEFLKGGPVVVQRSDTTTVEDSAEVSEPLKQMENSSLQNQAAVNSPPPAPTTPLAASNDSLVRAAVSKGFDANRPPENAEARFAKVTTYYIEIARPALRQLILDSQATGQFSQFGEVSSGAVPDIAQKLPRLAGATTHHSVEEPIDPKLIDQSWYVGTRESSNDPNSTAGYGLTTSIIFNEFSANSVRGEVEVRRVFPEGEGKPTVVTRSFPATFDLSPRAGFMMAGIIPHKIWMEGLDKLKPDGFFKIYNSKNFESGQTEFVMLFKFDPPKANNETAN